MGPTDIKGPRKLVQIAVGVDGESPGGFGPALFALADDGSVWMLSFPGFSTTSKDWHRLPPLPPEKEG